MKTDSKIKIDVQDELSWEPSIDETKIGVTVDKGVVTLSGTVNTYAKKLAVEKAAKRVQGVKAVAEDIEVVYGVSYKPNDTEIAKAAVNAIKWDTSIPDDKVMIKVEDGWVYLSGEVNWDYQKRAAKGAVQNLIGVRGVVNSIKLKSTVKSKDVKNRISEAFKRSATIDSNKVKVAVDGDTVTLTGTVTSIKEKEDAQRAAYFAPGIYNVKNNLKVDFESVYA
ncbi:BON domain-containing protein [Maribacter sp. ACAM166]|uniref:BON domain-containing protein n=1 Tax=Maribacter sp. ACAM166 TaxID=2508996 RepID=UPI0010FDE36F|nr:BON domain-containing protein [Maribacter sp. ACAM166]TLP81742.1 BON domain-containing protein [Maribacter sp. ACAM166]